MKKLDKKVLIVINSALYNRGSEALLTGLSQICRKAGTEYLGVSSADLKSNDKLNIPLIDRSEPRYQDVYQMPYVKRILSIVRGRIDCSDLLTRISCGAFLKGINRFDLIIIIGADNFDYKVRFKSELASLTEMIKKSNKTKLLLYDCSIDHENIDVHFTNALKFFDAITVRDVTSFKNLKRIANDEKLSYFPDPAFIIAKEQVDIRLKILDDQIVGINASNLIVGDLGSPRYKLVFNSYCKLIECIIYENYMGVLLIPHVMNNADLSILKKLYQKYQATGKVVLIENEHLNARQLKYLISKCRFFIGARTHATIAAYSSCVPTLALGYSIKSIGIARDLFGTEKNYVISVDDLKNDSELVNGFRWLQANENQIRNKLHEVMPKYTDEVWKTADLIKILLEN